MTADAVVVGVGNEYRRDDGVGLAAVRLLADTVPAGTTLTCVSGEPTGLIECWAGKRLAIVLDAAVCDPPQPGRIHRTTMAPLGGFSTSSHGLGVPEALELAAALDRLPEQLVVLTVEAAETGYGAGLSPVVAAALPALASLVLAELGASGEW